MSILVWNARGAGKSKKKRIWNLINSKEAIIGILLETKIRACSKEHMNKTFPTSRCVSSNCDEAFLGRVCIGWNPMVWEMNCLDMSYQHMANSYKYKGGMHIVI